MTIQHMDFVGRLSKGEVKSFHGGSSHRYNRFTRYVKRPFYRFLHRFGLRVGNRRLASWAYTKLFSTYTFASYFEFVADYIGCDISDLVNVGKIDISA